MRSKFPRFRRRAMVMGVSLFKSLSWMEAPCSSKGWMQSVLPMAATTCRGVLPRGDLARQFAPVRLKRPAGVVGSPGQGSHRVTLRYNKGAGLWQEYNRELMLLPGTWRLPLAHHSSHLTWFQAPPSKQHIPVSCSKHIPASCCLQSTL